MAIFGSNIQQVSTATSTAAVIWDTDNTSSSTYGPLGAITAGSVLRDVTIENQGPDVVYIGGSTVTTATGLAVPVGGQVTIQGYDVTSVASSTTGDISGICASSQTANVVVGLASVPSVV